MSDLEVLMDWLLKCQSKDSVLDREVEESAKTIAEFLIAMGVKVPAKVGNKCKQPTDLKNKCGSCVHAKSTVAFGGSECYVLCRLPGKRFKTQLSAIRPRTTKACLKYEGCEE